MRVVDYLDYRIFLSDFYRERKRLNASYSYRVFANLGRIRSPNYLKLVIDGKRRITERSLESFILALKLQNEDAEYFRCLVRSEEAADPADRLNAIRQIYEFRNLTPGGWAPVSKTSEVSAAQ